MNQLKRAKPVGNQTAVPQTRTLDFQMLEGMQQHNAMVNQSEKSNTNQ